MKVLIVGGGIGGLSVAGFLEQKGFDVTLIERSPEWKHIGFGITLWSNGRKLLEKFGIDAQIAGKGTVIPWVELRDKNGGLIYSRAFADFEGRRDHPAVIVERATLHDALVRNLKTTLLRLGTTVKGIKNQKDKVCVKFGDGTEHVFDLVVAADGINSQIRENIFGLCQKSFYGWSTRCFWLPAHIPKSEGVVMFSKERLTIGFFPVNQKCFVIIYEYNPERINLPPRIDDFLSYLIAQGWTEEYIRDFMAEAREGYQYYDHLCHITSGDWYKGRIVLLGDAQHGFSPIAGMGANMAIEDGFVLADELAKVVSNRSGTIDLALQNYAKRRTPRLAKVIHMNDFSDKVYLIRSSLARKARDILACSIPRKLIGRTLRQILDEAI